MTFLPYGQNYVRQEQISSCALTEEGKFTLSSSFKSAAAHNLKLVVLYFCLFTMFLESLHTCGEMPFLKMSIFNILFFPLALCISVYLIGKQL